MVVKEVEEEVKVVEAEEEETILRVVRGLTSHASLCLIVQSQGAPLTTAGAQPRQTWVKM